MREVSERNLEEENKTLSKNSIVIVILNLENYLMLHQTNLCATDIFFKKENITKE